MRFHSAARRFGEIVLSGAGGWMCRVAVWTIVIFGASLAWASGPPPDYRIPLEPLGYEKLLPEFLMQGDSLLTVDFVDRDHLLVTFALRKLLTRDPDALPDDDDRMIGAILVEIPSGKAVARTEWRVHDRSQYLWNIGRGRFLLRIRDRITLFAPMRGLASGDAFRQEVFFDQPRHVVAMLISSDDDLLTLETTARQGVQVNADAARADHSPVQVNFYRISDAENGKLQMVFAGVVRTQDAVEFPMTSAGILHITSNDSTTWMFDFDEHAGKVDELLAFDTSCTPRAKFVSHSQFVVFGCRGSDDKPDIAGFDLKGDQMWQQTFSQNFAAPTFAFAPGAGRFALSRTLIAAPTDVSLLAPTLVTGQDVRVYQVNSGKVLIKVDCTPVMRSSENFALSEDGTRLAVIQQEMVHHPATADYFAWDENSTGVDIYELPPLTPQDRAAVERAQKMAPADTGARIDVSLERISARQGASEVGGGTGASGADASSGGSTAASGTATGSAAAPGASAQEPGNPAMASSRDSLNTAGTDDTSRAGETSVAGVDAPSARKPPTLYGPDDPHPQQDQPQ